jgi:hypothetical protein
MLFKSPVYSQASGSIAGIVYSHNAGGMYTRARTVPTDPSTARQVAIRGYVAAASNIWINGLTATQRSNWAAYAANVPLLGPLGDPRNVSGLNMYTRQVVARLQAGKAPVADAPTVYDLGDFTAPTLTSIDDAALATIDYEDLDDWCGEVGGFMSIFASAPQNPTRNYWKGPYRFVDSIDGAVSPPASPALLTIPYTCTIGQRVFFRCLTGRADGRISYDYRFDGLVTAAP